jgi:hypothetical protein
LFNINDAVKLKPLSPLYTLIGDEVGIVVGICECDNEQLISVYFEIYGCIQGLIDQALYEKVV